MWARREAARVGPLQGRSGSHAGQPAAGSPGRRRTSSATRTRFLSHRPRGGCAPVSLVCQQGRQGKERDVELHSSSSGRSMMSAAQPHRGIALVPNVRQEDEFNRLFVQHSELVPRAQAGQRQDCNSKPRWPWRAFSSPYGLKNACEGKQRWGL
jgi:hypothetical protein